VDYVDALSPKHGKKPRHDHGIAPSPRSEVDTPEPGRPQFLYKRAVMWGSECACQGIKVAYLRLAQKPDRDPFRTSNVQAARYD
jgi:hypothetical protein